MNPSLKIRKEDELILLCANMLQNTKTKKRILELITNDLNWDYFLKMVSKHKLKPITYLNLKNCMDFIPNQVHNNLIQFYKDNAKKNLFFVMELIKILEIFEESKINMIFYKGPILAYLAYRDLSSRQFADLDLFVSPINVNQAKKLLYSIGYECELELNDMQEIKFITSQQELKFFNKQNNITVDLHWKLSLLHLVKTDYLIQKKTNFMIFNKSIRTLMPEEMFLLICIHNSSHRWSALSLICDLSGLILNNNLNWFKIQLLAKNMGITRIVHINLFLIKNTLNLDLCPKNIDLDEDSEARDIAFKVQKKLFSELNNFSLLEDLRVMIKIRDSKIVGLYDVMQNLFIATSYEWKKIPLPVQISFMYIIIRPFLLLTRYKI